MADEVQTILGHPYTPTLMAAVNECQAEREEAGGYLVRAACHRELARLYSRLAAPNRRRRKAPRPKLQAPTQQTTETANTED